MARLNPGLLIVLFLILFVGFTYAGSKKDAEKPPSDSWIPPFPAVYAGLCVGAYAYVVHVVLPLVQEMGGMARIPI